MITKQQALTARAFHAEGACHRSVGPRGGVTETSEVWRRNGATKTWLTRPNEFRLPIKYGLRDYSAISELEVNRMHVPEDCLLNDPNWEG